MKTHLKNGNLSKFGFACGYIQREKGLRKGDVWMYQEIICYHVRTSKEWFSFNNLKDARNKYNELVKQNL